MEKKTQTCDVVLGRRCLKSQWLEATTKLRRHSEAVQFRKKKASQQTRKQLQLRCPNVDVGAPQTRFVIVNLNY